MKALPTGWFAAQAAAIKKQLRTLAAEKGSLYWSLILRSDWLMGGKGWPVSANQRPRKKSGANPSPSSLPAKEQAVTFGARYSLMIPESRISLFDSSLTNWACKLT